MKKLSIFALAAVAALSACAKDDAANGDSTAVLTDTAAMSAPMAPATTDTAMVPGATTNPMDTTAGATGTDTAATDTAAKM